MFCDNNTHNHQWVTEGELIIERCEHICLFCPGLKQFEHAWFLRRHVTQVHSGRSHPNLKVSPGWTGKPEGNAKPNSGHHTTRRAKKLKNRAITQTVTPPPEPVLACTQVVQPFSNQGVVTKPHVGPPVATQPAIKVEQLTPPIVQSIEFDNTFPSFGCDAWSNFNLNSPSVLFPGTVTSFAPITPQLTVSDLDALFPELTSPSSNTSDSTSTANSISTDGCIDPSFLLTDTVYEHSAAYVCENLNLLFTNARARGTITDEQLLGTVEAYVEAFKNGRGF